MSWPEGEDGSIDIPPDDDPRQPTIGSGGGICFVSGDMVISSSETSIDPGSSASLSIENGCGPFNWTVSGTGFSLDNNTLNSSGSACGSATVTVTDALGRVATGHVRSTNGQWVLASLSSDKTNPACIRSCSCDGSGSESNTVDAGNESQESIVTRVCCACDIYGNDGGIPDPSCAPFSPTFLPNCIDEHQTVDLCTVYRVDGWEC